MGFDYFYGRGTEQFAFYQVPKMLITDDRFAGITMDSKFLYSLLLDRSSLSAKNGWLDEEGKVYIYYTLEQIMADMHCANQKATKLLKELETKAGLIERQKQGQGKPTRIYVKDFATGLHGDGDRKSKIVTHENHDSQTHENRESRDVKITSPDSWKDKNVNRLVETIVKEHARDDKDPFYSLVETVFRIIGVDCHKSRDGVIGERWDAMIRDQKRSIPIEIKSPRECEHLSLKAIRQAIENKIILLSRKSYPTTEDCSSYAVGYYAPNDRAEISGLINDIKATYGYKIAVFDIESLIKITVNIILFNKGIDIEELYGLEGIVDVKDIKR